MINTIGVFYKYTLLAVKWSEKGKYSSIQVGEDFNLRKHYGPDVCTLLKYQMTIRYARHHVSVKKEKQKIDIYVQNQKVEMYAIVLNFYYLIVSILF